MTKILTDQVDKATISQMPRDSFEGRIVVVQKEAEVDEAVNYLLGQKVLGFDTETRPSFHKGHMNQVALLQVASRDVCFLFRLNKLGLPDGIVRLLTENSVLKVGLSWHDDLHSLHRLKAFQCAPFVELQDYAHRLGITDMSLQKLYAIVFGKRITKSQQLSNWENDALSEAQKLYAATDAWACIMLYEEISRLLQSGDYELRIVPKPEPEPPGMDEVAEPAPELEKSPAETKEQKARDKPHRHKTHRHKHVQKPLSEEGQGRKP